MCDTNALLSVAFSIIATFTNTVHIHPNAVPASERDLATYQIGRRYFPCDLYLRHREGAQYWISGGVVEVFYDTPNNYFELQDPQLIPKFLAPARLSTNEVLDLATQTVGKLLVQGNPLQDKKPILRPAGYYQGRLVPFYDVRWPLGENGQVFSLAHIAVDARNGYIVQVALSDEAFYNPVSLQQISNIVFADPAVYKDYQRQINFLRYGTNAPPAEAPISLPTKSPK